MILNVFNIIAPIVIIVSVGYLYAKKYQTDVSVINKLTLDIFVPALVLSVLIDKEFDILEYKELSIGAILVVFISGLLAWLTVKVTRFNAKTFIPPMMYVNSGNIGLPLVLLAFGKEAMAAAIVLFIIENTLHFTLGIKTLDRSASLIDMLKIPIILASIFGIVFNLIQFEPPEIILTPLAMIGNIAIPLMLFTLGVRLTDTNLNDWKIGIIGAVFRPLYGLIALVVVIPLLHLSELNQALLVIFAILPPAVLNFLVSEKYNQEPEKVVSIVLIGNLFSIVTIPITLYFLLSTTGIQ